MQTFFIIVYLIGLAGALHGYHWLAIAKRTKADRNRNRFLAPEPVLQIPENAGEHTEGGLQ